MQKFLKKFHDELSTYWSWLLDTQRARALNPEAVKAWFNLVQKWIVDNGILPENIYGMDKSGFSPAFVAWQQVIGGKSVKTQHQQGGANKENITALVDICADRTALEPMIIFKGKHLIKKWGEDNIAQARYKHSQDMYIS